MNPAFLFPVIGWQRKPFFHFMNSTTTLMFDRLALIHAKEPVISPTLFCIISGYVNTVKKLFRIIKKIVLTRGPPLKVSQEPPGIHRSHFEDH